VLRDLLPQGLVVGAVGFHQAADFGDGALGWEEAARLMLQHLLGFGESKLHVKFLMPEYSQSEVDG
jgi:hypothetical protein